MMNTIENVRFGMNQFYQTFFCVLCDGDNHKFFNVKFGRILIDTRFCAQMLKSNKKPIRAFSYRMLTTVSARFISGHVCPLESLTLHSAHDTEFLI